MQPAEREGDILAQTASTRTAEARLHRLGEEHGAATIRAALDRLDDLSEAQMREAIADLPDPRRAALAFGLSAIRHACDVCDWDPALAASARGALPPLT